MSDAPPHKLMLHQNAVETIRRMILSGELPPGQRLTEMSLSKQLGMSRTPIREAFRTLAAEGVVDLLPDRGVLVSEVDQENAAQVFLVLGTLEGLAAELSCANMSSDQMESLAELQDDLERHFLSSDRPRYLESNRLIHELIVQSSANHALILAWRLLLPRAERARQVSTLDHGRWADAFAEHRKIFAALVARDAPLVKQLMIEHFMNGIASAKKLDRDERAKKRLEAYAAAAAAAAAGKPA